MYSAEQRASAITAVLSGLAKGTPLTVICRADGMPDPSTVWDWKQDDDKLSQDIARARDIGFDAIAESIMEIIDDETIDHASRRVRAEYRLKLLAKWDPKRYGELLKHGNADGSNFDLAARIMAGNAKVGE